MSRRARETESDEEGQSSVEYAAVLFAFLAIIIALGALIHVGQAGGLLERATRSSSHVLGEGVVGGMQDILLY